MCANISTGLLLQGTHLLMVNYLILHLHYSNAPGTSWYAIPLKCPIQTLNAETIYILRTIILHTVLTI
jgi:hypothetical protein